MMDIPQKHAMASASCADRPQAASVRHRPDATTAPAATAIAAITIETDCQISHASTPPKFPPCRYRQKNRQYTFDDKSAKPGKQPPRFQEQQHTYYGCWDNGRQLPLATAKSPVPFQHHRHGAFYRAGNWLLPFYRICGWRQEAAVCWSHSAVIASIPPAITNDIHIVSTTGVTAS